MTSHQTCQQLSEVGAAAVHHTWARAAALEYATSPRGSMLCSWLCAVIKLPCFPRCDCRYRLTFLHCI